MSADSSATHWKIKEAFAVTNGKVNPQIPWKVENSNGGWPII